MGAAADPVFDSVVVEGDKFFIVNVGERVVRSQLLDIFTVSRPFIIGGHDAVEGSVCGAP